MGWYEVSTPGSFGDLLPPHGAIANTDADSYLISEDLLDTRAFIAGLPTIPEPSTATLVIVGFAVAAIGRRRRSYEEA